MGQSDGACPQMSILAWHCSRPVLSRAELESLDAENSLCRLVALLSQPIQARMPLDCNCCAVALLHVGRPACQVHRTLLMFMSLVNTTPIVCHCNPEKIHGQAPFESPSQGAVQASQRAKAECCSRQRGVLASNFLDRTMSILATCVRWGVEDACLLPGRSPCHMGHAWRRPALQAHCGPPQ